MSVSQHSTAVPKEFRDLVRDALLHLHDPPYLQTHPLAQARPADSDALARGKWLYNLLLDGIAALRPPAGTPISSRPWRTYRLLELRYLDGRDVADVVDRLAISRIQYYRDHQRALDAVTSILWDRWRSVGEWRTDVAAALSGSLDASELIRREARALAPREGSSRLGTIDPTEVLRSVGRLLEPLCAQREVTFTLLLPDDLPSIRGDRVALRQALLVLITGLINAIRGGAVAVVAEQQSDHVEIRVVVESPSIPSAVPYERAFDESRPFVEALRGEVEWYSEHDDTGRWEVRIRFPVSQRTTLLVVDNNADFVRLVEQYLARHGWQVAGATSVEDAIAQVQRECPRAILLDIVIPGHDGWELLAELKQDVTTRHLPVIVCSVLSEPEIALSLGAAAYLQKPIDELTLVAALSPFR